MSYFIKIKVDKFALLQNKLGKDVSRSVDLAPFTTFGIGGPAKYFFTARNSKQLIAAYEVGVAGDISVFILGGGSNILFADEGINSLVIKDETDDYSVDGEIISAQSGVLLDKIVDIAVSHSLTGFEFAAGIPGTVGGAVYGNAGAFGGCIADILESAVVYNPDGGIKVVDRDYFEFSYRNSRLKKSREFVLSARFNLKSGQKIDIADKTKGHRQLRKRKHPTKEGCAGSVFKNIKEPKLLPAGKLLEEAGARGLKVGEAEVFEKHCNIIVNKGKARASDVRKLAELMQKMVFDKFNIRLEYELIILKP